MALQLKGRARRNWRLPVTAGAVVIGVGFIALKTFPHLKDSLTQLLSGQSTSEDDNEPIELDNNDEEDTDTEALAPGSVKESTDVSQWREEELKSWLHEVSQSISNQTSSY